MSNKSTRIFLFEQLLSNKVGFTVVKAAVVEAAKSALLNKSCSNKKNPCGFVTQTFKVGITNPRGFFDLSNFYLVKLVSLPLLLLIEKIQNSTTSSKVKLQAQYATSIGPKVFFLLFYRCRY